MLSKFDDYLIHQTPAPIQYYHSSDPRAFDRFYFCIHDRSGEFAMAFGGGAYPNLNVMDAGVGVVYKGKQHNIRMSRTLTGADRTDTTIGPIRFEVLEGLKAWRIILDDNEYGISFDLEFIARSEPLQTPQITWTEDNFQQFDQCHYTQSGRFEGFLRVGDREFNVTPDEFYGHRDRSWGVRPVAGIGRTGRPPSEWGAAMHLWLPIQFKDRCLFLMYQEDKLGNQHHIAGAPLYEDGTVGAPWMKVEHEINLDPVTRLHKTSTLHLTQADGVVTTLTTRQLLPGIYIRGLGYEHHGIYRGELAVEGDTYNLDVSPEQLAKLTVFGADQLAEFRCGDDVGYGIYEHFVSPNHIAYPPNSGG